jgi:hypothetical protein
LEISDSILWYHMAFADFNLSYVVNEGWKNFNTEFCVASILFFCDDLFL